MEEKYALNLERLKRIEEMNMKKISKDNQLEMYKKIVEHMSESIWIGDENERTIYANPNFCRLLGYSLDEIVGRESYDFRDQESLNTVVTNNELRKEGEASKYEGVLKAKDGTLIPVLCSGTPIPGGGTVGIMTDLREVKTLLEAREELKALNKMKDEFIGIVGHELRTPLTIIKGYLSMLLDGDMGDLTKEVRFPIEQSFNSTISLIGLVNDMLDLSRMQSGKMVYIDKKLDIIEFGEGLYNDLKIIADQKDLNFSFKKIGKLEEMSVLIDPNKLKQIIINLINNAFKFTNPKGKVDFIIIDENDKIKIIIEDSGIGMSRENLEKIFLKFHQVDSYLSRTNEGLGLGLSISQGIANHYNSQIKVESEQGVGTKFYFDLDKYKIKCVI